MKLLSWKHLKNATAYSWAGLQHAWKAEQAFRHEVLCIPVIAVLLLCIRPGLLWSMFLVAGWCVVLAIELLNSAIEESFDMVTRDYNEHSKRGKDMASAAVGIVLCMNGLMWLAMLFDQLF